MESKILESTPEFDFDVGKPAVINYGKLGVVHRHVQKDVCTGCGGRLFGFLPECSLLGILYRFSCVCTSNYDRATSNHICEVLEKR